MQIIVNHLHRATAGFISVGGIEPRTGKHVRPLLNGSPFSSQSLLLSKGGLFDLGCLVELGSVEPCGKNPHIEDCTYDPGSACVGDFISGANFFQLLLENAEHDIEKIFGPDLHAQGMSGWLILAGKGRASLGLLSPVDSPELWLKPRVGEPDQIRITFRDRTMTRDLPVTDLRLFADERGTPKEREIDRLNEILQEEKKIVLGLALSPVCNQNGQESKDHWLYVSGVHWPGSALWRLSENNLN